MRRYHLTSPPACRVPHDQIRIVVICTAWFFRRSRFEAGEGGVEEVKRERGVSFELSVKLVDVQRSRGRGSI